MERMGVIRKMDALEQAYRIAGRLSGDVPPQPQEPPPPPEYTAQPQSVSLKSTWITHSFIDSADSNIKWIAVNRKNWRRRTLKRIRNVAIFLLLAWFVTMVTWVSEEWHLHIDCLDVQLWSGEYRREAAENEFISANWSEWERFLSPEPSDEDSIAYR